MSAKAPQRAYTPAARTTTTRTTSSPTVGSILVFLHSSDSRGSAMLFPGSQIRGRRDRKRAHSRGHCWAAKIAFDIAQVGRLTRKEVTDVHALSAWSLLVGGATAAMVPLAVPEARAAWGHLAHGRTGSVLGRFADQRGERDQRHTGRSGEISAHKSWVE